jgi:hypothetical protein
MKIELKTRPDPFNKWHLLWIAPILIALVSSSIYSHGLRRTMLAAIPYALGFAIGAYLMRQNTWIARLENGIFTINQRHLPRFKKSLSINIEEIQKIIIAGDTIAIITTKGNFELLTSFSQPNNYKRLAEFIEQHLSDQAQIIVRDKPSIFESQHGLYLD